jgi:hypothetical protein
MVGGAASPPIAVPVACRLERVEARLESLETKVDALPRAHRGADRRLREAAPARYRQAVRGHPRRARLLLSALYRDHRADRALS